MIRYRALICPPLIAAGLALAAFPAAADDGGRQLGDLIQQKLREGGSFFTADEQAVVVRACGYAPGEWDGYELDMRDGVLHCRNGRTVRDPEVRRVLRAAAPRISRRVGEIMSHPEVRAAIDRIADQATEQAMREIARLGH